MTAGGCLAAPTHYSGECNLDTGTMHQQSLAQALFAGFRFRNELPRPMHAFARINSGGNNFCLCRAGIACASKASCSNDTPSMPIRGVR